ncbi:hypothetical protein EXW28_04885 [Bacillus mycoides]|uniref:hypothetical protein n=1 Tax=Bacillus mycoides TaxID=1405 RepID=UPI001C00E5A0|nr:hypothetical protein [Bacillus mycoides]QWG49211.1 hypothetical protein EXW37_04885 [Bacillus mycoides]QWH33017.1 hypothetical protein EXW28_04885 [Bacillus mycoides]
MTKVGRLYEQEKQEEIDKALSAAGMLFKGMSIEEVAKKLDVTIERSVYPINRWVNGNIP